MKQNRKLDHKCGVWLCERAGELAEKKLQFLDLGEMLGFRRTPRNSDACPENLNICKTRFQLCFTNAVSDRLQHPHKAKGSTIALTQEEWGDFVGRVT